MNKSKYRCMIAGIAMMILPTHSLAATFEVNIFGDVSDFNTLDGVCDVEPLVAGPQCTLRAAVMSANATPGPDTIVIPPGVTVVLNLTGPGGHEEGDLDINTDMTIVGFTGDPPATEADLPVIDASALGDRHFDLTGGATLTLRGLRLIGGLVPAGESGGAVQSTASTLHVEWSLFRQNRADGGGALFVIGSNLNVTDSHFHQNTADIFYGSAIRMISPINTATIQRSSFIDNRGGGNGRQIFLSSVASTLLENVTIDGAETGPATPGLTACYGVQIQNSGDHIVRNSTIINHEPGGASCGAVTIRQFNIEDHVVVANSVLAGGNAACRIEDSSDADIVIWHSMINTEDGCAPAFDEVIIDSPELGGLSLDSGRITWSRRPDGGLANVVDRGIPENLSLSDPDLACTAEDQRGLLRPIDGNGDLTSRCDLGAIELEEPRSWTVNYAVQDLPDANPGDGFCEVLPMAIGNQCTLRAAVMEANALPGVQSIVFEQDLEPITLTLPPGPGADTGDLSVSGPLNINGNQLNDLPTTEIVQQAMARIFRASIGGMQTLRLNNLVLSGGEDVGPGGAVAVEFGQVIGHNLRFENNSSLQRGGAIHVFDGILGLSRTDLANNDAPEGSAISLGSNGMALLEAVSVRNHNSLDGMGIPVATIEAESSATLIVGNSTIANNNRGLFVDNADTFVLFGSTIAGNGASGLRAAFNGGGNFSFFGNIFANADAGGSDCNFVALASANALHHDYNLSGDGSCSGSSGTDLIGDAQLEALLRPARQVTWSMRPAHGAWIGIQSPALDVVPAELCVEADQHGQTRPVDLADIVNLDGPCDIGAVEVVASDVLFSDGYELE